MERNKKLYYIVIRIEKSYLHSNKNRKRLFIKLKVIRIKVDY
jgi:hypothetical protein